MSKASVSTKFRKVNVDAYDEDNYEDETGDGVSLADEVSQRANQCRELVNSGNKEEALKACLQNPPIAAATEKSKTTNYQTVMDVLNAFKPSEIERAAHTLEQHDLDVLMKYLYYGMSRPEDGYSPNLLVWHSSVVTAGGPGTIVRVLTERKTVW